MKQRQYLKDYRPSDWQIPRIHMRFDVQDTHVLVHTRMQVEASGDSYPQSLVLDGRQMTLVDIRIDDQVLGTETYQCSDTQLQVRAPSARFVLDTTVRLDPYSNTSLEGLYAAGGILCTQCESHGFSRITYALDRPDVMSVFTVDIEADKGRYPILLANGERTAQQDLADGRHQVSWSDPHPKPCYLFAMVAGDMACKTRPYTTSEGREVDIAFYCDHGIEDRMDHAIDSLVRSMQWDEQRYGLAYDLNTYSVVVAGAFNMGAMENKGLNIFNPKYVLASPESATDADFAAVEAVIGHEYFHNWTGNRVTCRDWFQLSLKEGLTVFRDQQFSADCGAGPAQRIEQVKFLRARQFAEDAGPLAHPVRPESYVEMNNFYTVTVYEKGAELVRLLHALEGESGFRRGMDLYFERHDGQAVTIEDFLAAHGDANALDLSGLQRWYGQAGTPRVGIKESWDNGRYTLDCTQSIPTNPEAEPVLIPIRLSLLDSRGQPLVDGQVLRFEQSQQQFSFDLAERPVPVLFEALSAPVTWDYPYTHEQLEHIVRYADDPFSRWEAAQRLYLTMIDAAYNATALADQHLKVFQEVIEGEGNGAVIAALLNPPSADELTTRYSALEPVRLCAAVRQTEQALARVLGAALSERTEALMAQTPSAYAFEPEAAAQRSLRACLLRLWCLRGEDRAWQQAEALYRRSDNLTDRLAALQALNQTDAPARETLLTAFHERYHSDKLVLDRWFALQAARDGQAGLAAVRALLEHPAFDQGNPNRVRALIGTFGMLNLSALHTADGEGVALLAEQILVYDKLNPQLAARLITPFAGLNGLSQAAAAAVRKALEKIVAEASSADVLEQAQRILEH